MFFMNHSASTVLLENSQREIVEHYAMFLFTLPGSLTPYINCYMPSCVASGQGHAPFWLLGNHFIISQVFHSQKNFSLKPFTINAI